MLYSVLFLITGSTARIYFCVYELVHFRFSLLSYGSRKNPLARLFSRCRIVVVYILGIYLVTDEIYLHFDNLRCRLIIFVSVYSGQALRPGPASARCRIALVLRLRIQARA